MNSYEWKSLLANKMQEFLTIKRMAGFKYEREGRLLEKFDEYCFVNGYTNSFLSREVVEGFCYGTYYEKDGTRYNKETRFLSLERVFPIWRNNPLVSPFRRIQK